MQTKDRHDLTVADQAPVTLTRIKGGKKGPVLLVHGVAVSSQIFALPTIRENFVQCLAKHGYDVWMLDWRGDLPPSLGPVPPDGAPPPAPPSPVPQEQPATQARHAQHRAPF